jgi:hypothetical protein
MMKRTLVALALAGIAATAATPAFAGPDVGVSIGINQPGVYGRINIGSYPQPALVYPQPVVVVQQPVAVQAEPLYLYVPLAHRQNWRRYCGRYNACGQPVYFVQERWVRDRWDHERRERFEHDRRRGVEARHDNGRHLGHGQRDERGEHGDRGERGEGHRHGH